ncbi:UNKNOWN [Stylonychia lemnae]|uniref:Uncharacterized protein n=1 Tax=Stylonychia lemnae TaxID=5949 RepID=A0A078AIU9_STYLE|nr:UNKNOWN [Stylonychia lemnae]|eukprot:CDW82149.1 UNKNOWN [Stylonychia lemnae]
MAKLKPSLNYSPRSKRFLQNDDMNSKILSLRSSNKDILMDPLKQIKTDIHKLKDQKLQIKYDNQKQLENLKQKKTNLLVSQNVNLTHAQKQKEKLRNKSLESEINKNSNKLESSPDSFRDQNGVADYTLMNIHQNLLQSLNDQDQDGSQDAQKPMKFKFLKKNSKKIRDRLTRDNIRLRKKLEEENELMKQLNEQLNNNQYDEKLNELSDKVLTRYVSIQDNPLMNQSLNNLGNPADITKRLSELNPEYNSNRDFVIVENDMESSEHKNYQSHGIPSNGQVSNQNQGNSVLNESNSPSRKTPLRQSEKRLRMSTGKSKDDLIKQIYFYDVDSLPSIDTDIAQVTKLKNQKFNEIKTKQKKEQMLQNVGIFFKQRITDVCKGQQAALEMIKKEDDYQVNDDLQEFGSKLDQINLKLMRQGTSDFRRQQSKGHSPKNSPRSINKKNTLSPHNNIQIMENSQESNESASKLQENQIKNKRMAISPSEMKINVKDINQALEGQLVTTRDQYGQLEINYGNAVYHNERAQSQLAFTNSMQSQMDESKSKDSIFDQHLLTSRLQSQDQIQRDFKFKSSALSTLYEKNYEKFSQELNSQTYLEALREISQNQYNQQDQRLILDAYQQNSSEKKKKRLNQSKTLSSNFIIDDSEQLQKEFISQIEKSNFSMIKKINKITTHKRNSQSIVTTSQAKIKIQEASVQKSYTPRNQFRQSRIRSSNPEPEREFKRKGYHRPKDKLNESSSQSRPFTDRQFKDKFNQVCQVQEQDFIKSNIRANKFIQSKTDGFGIDKSTIISDKVFKNYDNALSSNNKYYYSHRQLSGDFKSQLIYQSNFKTLNIPLLSLKQRTNKQLIKRAEKDIQQCLPMTGLISQNQSNFNQTFQKGKVFKQFGVLSILEKRRLTMNQEYEFLPTKEDQKLRTINSYRKRDPQMPIGYVQSYNQEKEFPNQQIQTFNKQIQEIIKNKSHSPHKRVQNVISHNKSKDQFIDPSFNDQVQGQKFVGKESKQSRFYHAKSSQNLKQNLPKIAQKKIQEPSIEKVEYDQL